MCACRLTAGDLGYVCRHGHWDPDPPDVDDAEQTMVAVAAGEIDEAELATWLRTRVTFAPAD